MAWASQTNETSGFQARIPCELPSAKSDDKGSVWSSAIYAHDSSKGKNVLEQV